MKRIMLSDKEFSGKTVVALGKFDGIHTGHARLLECAAKYAADEGALSLVYVMEREGGERLTSADEKTDIIRSFGIDALCIELLTQEFMNMSPEEFVTGIIRDSLHACHVVVGYNFRFGKGRSGDAVLLQKLCTGHKISVTVIDCVYATENGERVAVSSSEIRRLASLGRMEDIVPLLGRNYSVSGIVKPGKRLGRTIDFPTANIYKDARSFPLRHGVYITRVCFGGGKYPAITNVGINPTVEQDDGIVKIESHIPGVDVDLYGRELTVEFVEYIREERRFSSIDELKNQLTRDKEDLKRQAGVVE